VVIVPDNADLIEEYDDELQQLIERMHHSKIREEVIHFILDKAARDSEMRIIAKAELSPDAPQKP
jgi:hypothetical protein